MGMNENRANWAFQACEKFGQLTGADPNEEAPYDLLCNLLHLIESNGGDPETALAKAYAIYRSECEDPDGLGTEPAVTLMRDGKAVAAVAARVAG
jgi:hypothetical protein